MSTATHCYPISCPHCGGEIEIRHHKLSRSGLADAAYAVCGNRCCGAAYRLRSEIECQVKVSSMQRDIKGLKVIIPRSFSPPDRGRPPG